MRTDKSLLLKGIRLLAYTLIFMFTSPVVLYQAFKNQEHPWFWPVFVIGLLVAIAALASGFYAMKVIMDSLFGKKKG
ncbi:MAG: DUF6095 family protein [Bacteroidota bacterium]